MYKNNKAYRGYEYWLVLLLYLLLAGCATTVETEATTTPGDTTEKSAPQQAAKEPVNPDPWEGFNRAMYAFNDTLDEYFLKPIARGYEFFIPGLIRTGIANFFSNLDEPTVFINDLLQGKVIQASADTGRFLVNSTVGILGFIDVATSISLEKHQEDFGQTLGVWGVDTGPFVVWPFLGAMNVRDTAGWTADWITDPVTHVNPVSVSWGLWFTDVVDRRSQLLGAKDVLNEASSGDPYIFLREAYKQQRLYKVYDGNPPVVQDAEFDNLLFSDDPPKK